MPPSLTNRGGLVWRRRYRCGSPIQADDRAPVFTKFRATRGGLDVPQQMVKRRLRSPSPFDRPRGNSRRAASALRFVNRGRPLCGPAGRDGMRRGPTPRCALKNSDPGQLSGRKSILASGAPGRGVPPAPKMRKTPPRGRARAGQPRREPPWGPAGRCQITFSTVSLATLGYFFCRGTPCGLPRCVGTAVRARKSGMEVRTVSRGDVALAALEERWRSEEAPARPSAALPARLHPLATTRQLCRPTPPRLNNPSPSSLHML